MAMDIKKLLPWVIFFVICSASVVGLDYRARENDTRLYAKTVTQLAERPFLEMMTPKWNGMSPFGKLEKTGYVRDHYPGQFVIPVLIEKAGFPKGYSLYVWNIFCRILTLWFLYGIALAVLGRGKEKTAAMVMVLMQFFSIAFNYLLRANHETPQLLACMIGIYGALKLKEGNRYLILIAFASVMSFSIKGLLGTNILLFIPLAYLYSVNWKFDFKGLGKIGLSFLAVPAYVGLHELYFKTVTGHRFFLEYIYIHTVQRKVNNPGGFKMGLSYFDKLKYYLPRVLGYSAPLSLWAMGLLGLNFYRKKSSQLRQFIWLMFFMAFAQVIAASLLGWTASRYIFVSYYFVALAFSLYITESTKWLARFIDRLSFNKINFMAATLWGASILIALGVYFAKGGNNHWVH